jgi:hypothetical protein
MDRVVVAAAILLLAQQQPAPVHVHVTDGRAGWRGVLGGGEGGTGPACDANGVMWWWWRQRRDCFGGHALRSLPQPSLRCGEREREREAMGAKADGSGSTASATGPM